MKKILFVIGAVALLVGAGACKKIDSVSENESSVLNVSWGDQETKGVTGQLTSESTINNMWFYVFDKNGMLEIAHECTADEINAKKASILCKVDAAAKTVWAIANVPAAVRTNLNSKAKIADLEAVSFSLADNNQPSIGFILKGKNTCTVASSGGSCTIQLIRPVSKVALRSVKNTLPSPYGAITLKHAFLCNVVGNQNIAGIEAASSWLNQQATPDHGGANHVIGTGGYEAQEKGHTFALLGDNVVLGATKTYPVNDNNGKYFYGMPNALTSEPGNPGYTSSFTPTCSVLMVVATILGTDYYYPIPLKQGKFLANTDNLVDVTLIGLGNTVEEGVFNKIEKATLTATVEVKDWETGSTYTETI